MPTRSRASSASRARVPGEEPVSEDNSLDAKYKSLRRGLRSRRRDDHALDLFRRIETNLVDIRAVDRMLLELGRCYNPLTNAPIVDLATRLAIVEALEAGQREEAQARPAPRPGPYAPPAAPPKMAPPEPGGPPVPGEPG